MAVSQNGIDSATTGVRGICVTGMHRSGTSLVAQLLQRRGFHLGADADLMPSDPYNPDGYFENLRFVAINNALLEAFGGSWDHPPDFPEGWERSDTVESLVGAAAQAVATLSDRPWAFKDPRASLTLPFWQRTYPGLEYVVCVRSPAEVAASLARRDDMSFEASLGLWAAHYRAILANTSAADRIVVDYESLCQEPEAVCAWLFAKLDLAPIPATDEPTAGVVRPSLHHHRATLEALAARGVPGSVLDLYAQLRHEAGSDLDPAPEGRTEGDRLEEVVLLLRGMEPAQASWDLAVRDVHVDVRRLLATTEKALLPRLLEMEARVARLEDLLSSHTQGTANTMEETKMQADLAV